MIENIRGGSILVKNVSKDELEKYQEWINETSWSGNMGYTLYPSRQQETVTMMIDSGFSHTWRNDILPALEEYWGDGRIIHEVEFQE